LENILLEMKRVDPTFHGGSVRPVFFELVIFAAYEYSNHVYFPFVVAHIKSLKHTI